MAGRPPAFPTSIEPGARIIQRARRRVAEMRALHGDDDNSEVFVNKWYAAAPPGWTYEWKTHSVFE